VGNNTAERELAPLLAGTWAGDVLARMEAHEQRRIEARRAHAESQDPERARQHREEKRRLRAEAHAERLTLKKERDRVWRQRQGKGKP
jgi:hypothetical protein